MLCDKVDYSKRFANYFRLDAQRYKTQVFSFLAQVVPDIKDKVRYSQIILRLLLEYSL